VGEVALEYKPLEASFWSHNSYIDYSISTRSNFPRMDKQITRIVELSSLQTRIDEKDTVPHEDPRPRIR
jgi:UDP-galactopyranose mutase